MNLLLHFHYSLGRQWALVTNHFFGSDHFAVFLIGSQLVPPPAHASQDLPPDSHSGLRAGGLARRQADRSLTLHGSLERRVHIVEGSHCHIA